MSYVRRAVVKALSDDSSNATPRDSQKSDGSFIGRLKLLMVM